MAQNPKLTKRFSVISAAGEYEIGDAADGAIVSSHSVRLVPSTVVALNGGAITVKARSRGTEPETNGDNAGVAVPYSASHLNGAAGTELPVTTAIASGSLILIPSSGRVPILSVAAIVAGSWNVYVDSVQGAA
jgi:hypothetical protein